jgi:hypothetical protein
MPHAAFSTTAPTERAAFLPTLPITTKHRGSPNLALAPRCGARPTPAAPAAPRRVPGAASPRPSTAPCLTR